MQKIQFYLVPNRITVTTDLVGFNTEYRKVYQRKIKIYKGIDNTIEIEVKNSEQRRQDVMGYDVVVKFFDAERKNLFTTVGSAIPSKPGLMSVTIGQDIIAKIDPQMMTVAALLRNDNEEKILYADSQFEVLAQAELLNGYNDSVEPMETLTVFNWEYDSKQYVSEIAKFGARLNDDYSTEPNPENRTITVEFQGPYEGLIEAEATKDKSTAYGTNWTQIFTNETGTDWDANAYNTVTYSGDWRFIRFKHGGTGPGFGATFNVTATGSTYNLVSVINRGANYRVGDILVIKGSFLGGDDGVNDLTITVQEINVYPLGSINSVTGITWSGTAVGNGYYRNIRADNLVSSKSIDKIIIRN